MSKAIKEMIVDDITGRLGDVRDMLVLDLAKLDGVSTNRFRLGLQKSQITALTVRNSLARKALGNVGLNEFDSILQGPSTLVWGSTDIVALSKEITNWCKELKEIEIKGGAIEGTPLTQDDVEKLSKSPSREELISQIVGQILSPGARLAGALLGPGAALASQVSQIADKAADSGGESETA